MTKTTEDYLKQIYIASEEPASESKKGLVGLGRLAETMKVTPGTVTTMMKNLQEAGHLDYHPRSGVILTPQGCRKALEVLRRHRLIELFLVKIIGLDWKYVHDEAEVLEHTFSERLLERVDELLDHPSVDPHGDPIPASDGAMPQKTGTPLCEIDPPCELTIMRVEHQQKQFLEFLSDRDLTPGTTITLTARDNMAGTLTIIRNEEPTTISLATAELISVVKND